MPNKPLYYPFLILPIICPYKFEVFKWAISEVFSRDRFKPPYVSHNMLVPNNAGTTGMPRLLLLCECGSAARELVPYYRYLHILVNLQNVLYSLGYIFRGW
jgi:hypothetical protein